MKILITGGAGFIGSALIRYLIQHTEHQVCNLDKLTYAVNLDSLASVVESDRYRFEKLDINELERVNEVIESFQPDAVINLAAESHVDRSIEDAHDFIHTNVNGVHSLLTASLGYYQSLNDEGKQRFRFLQVSTDEVYGDLSTKPNELFTEDTPYAPSSPYSASKAAADHLVRAWGRTYGLPILITCCSNNFGPFQHPEKLIPKVISCALAGKPIPVYGDGQQSRDWIYVDDHVQALMKVLESGSVGETYNIGGRNEKKNIEVVMQICGLLDELAPHQRPPHLQTYSQLIEHVEDRLGHDQRYAVDTAKIHDLGRLSIRSYKESMCKTVEWYISNFKPPIQGEHRQIK